MQSFQSNFSKTCRVSFPNFSDIRIMMMPIVIGDISSIPNSVGKYDVGSYKSMLQTLFKECPDEYLGKVGYLTIDEKKIKKGESHRRGGLHVDGWKGSDGWSGGSSWSNSGNLYGMLLASSKVGCQAWNKTFIGAPGDENSCEHLRDQATPEEGVLMEENTAYWCGGSCVHESIIQNEDVDRQFLRLSMPNNGHWYVGYTENPLGIKPSGKIINQKRIFMDDGYNQKEIQESITKTTIIAST